METKNLDDLVEVYEPPAPPPEPEKTGIAKLYEPTDFYILSADLASISDFTALIVNQVFRHKTQRRLRALQTRHIERPQLGTAYPEIIKTIERLIKTPPLYGKCYLVIEDNGPGRVVTDTIRDHGFNVISVFTSAGETVSYREDLNRYTTPKMILVGSLNLMLQTGRLEISERLPLAPILKQELHDFRIKARAGGRVTYESATAALHDDTVVASAIGAWFVNHVEWLPDEEPQSMEIWAE